MSEPVTKTDTLLALCQEQLEKTLKLNEFWRSTVEELQRAPLQNPTHWKEKVKPGEEVLLTKNERGVPEEEETKKTPFCRVQFKEGKFAGFFDLRNQTSYSASGLCKANFKRNGKTNEYQGPMHCLVKRDEEWVPVGKL